MNYSISALITNEKDEIVLVQDTSNLWFFPKGFYSGEFDEITTIKNKIEKETGIKELEFIKELKTYERPSLNDDGTENMGKIKTIKLIHFKTKIKHFNPTDEDIKQVSYFSYNNAIDTLSSETDKEILKTLTY